MAAIVRPASEADLPAIMELLALKAEFDGCRDALVATEEPLRQAFFSSSPRAQVFLAVINGQAIGLATYFQTFSTYLAKPGIWLDDLYVREGYRSRGVGKSMMTRLARTAKELRCHVVSIHVCRQQDVETVLQLWRQADATPSATDTAEQLLRAVERGPRLSA